jgi:hypothetical protein
LVVAAIVNCAGVHAAAAREDAADEDGVVDARLGAALGPERDDRDHRQQEDSQQHPGEDRAATPVDARGKRSDRMKHR